MKVESNVFRHRAFALFWSSRFLMNLGVAVESVTLGWQVYALARQTRSVPESAFLVGMVGLVQFLPLFALTLTAGAVADRYDRRLITLFTLAVEIVCVVALAALALHPSPSLTPIFIIAALFGAARAFMAPATSAMAPMLVPRAELPQAIAVNAMAWQFAAVGGPFLGGVLVAGSAALAYGVTAAIYLGSALFLAPIRVNTRPEHQPGSQLTLIREGLAYLWSNKIVLGAISLDLVAVLLGGATALMPVFARDVLHVGPTGFGLLRAGPALGAVVTGYLLARNPIRSHAGLWLFAGVGVFGLATLVFAVSQWLVLTVAALAVLGAGDMLSVFVRQSLVQIVTPDAMRGRVSAVSGLFIGASNELGEFETGIVARVVGPVVAALFGGFCSLAATGIWAGLFPELRKADSLTRPIPDEPIRADVVEAV
ncbi:MAG TPA: MFS transporter [Caulobacteraceae bacterium]|jgi:MFS family permease|nr:MFS transporter [Caulobacteraceae bacterium]